MEDIITVAGIQFYKSELHKAYFEEGKKFIIRANGIYQIQYSAPAGFSSVLLMRLKNYMRKDRFLLTDAAGANYHAGRIVVID